MYGDAQYSHSLNHHAESSVKSPFAKSSPLSALDLPRRTIIPASTVKLSTRNYPLSAERIITESVGGQRGALGLRNKGQHRLMKASSETMPCRIHYEVMEPQINQRWLRTVATPNDKCIYTYGPTTHIYLFVDSWTHRHTSRIQDLAF